MVGQHKGGAAESDRAGNGERSLYRGRDLGAEL